MQAAPARVVGRLSGLRVLIVDDDDDARALARVVPAGAGAHVDEVASVGEALRALRETRPDVMLSDVRMPGEDGYALIRCMRAEGIETPAIALTAYCYPIERAMALEAGFDLHVGKPCPSDVLVTMIRKLADSRAT